MTTLMTTTLPTLVAMGVVNETTKTMFGKSRKGSKGKTRVVVSIVGVAKTKPKALKMASDYRSKLARKGLTGKVVTRKTGGGYAVIYYH